MGLLGAAIGAGFVAGPALGGMLKPSWWHGPLLSGSPFLDGGHVFADCFRLGPSSYDQMAQVSIVTVTPANSEGIQNGNAFDPSDQCMMA
jgi:hypothetical protein